MAQPEAENISDFTGNTQRFIAEQRDSSNMPLADNFVDFVITDPPYFDSVQYSDLSHFFRVWLQWFLPDTGRLALCTCLVCCCGNRRRGTEIPGIVLGAIFGEANRVLKRPHGRLVFTFHHWRADAWIQLTLALKAARFRLIKTYTVHSENPISVHIRQLNALRHDSILVFQTGSTSPLRGALLSQLNPSKPMIVSPSAPIALTCLVIAWSAGLTISRLNAYGAPRLEIDRCRNQNTRRKIFGYPHF